MVIEKMSQPAFSEVIDQRIDLVICASGYESRASNLASTLGKVNCRRIAFGFKEKKEEGARISNDQKFKNNGFELIEMPNKASDEIVEMLERLLNELNLDCCRVLIDISSMTRSWYGGIIRALRKESTFSKIIADFIYTPAVYNKIDVDDYPPNEIVASVKGFSSLCFPDKPTALVLGIGWDKQRAIGLFEELDPKIAIVFHTFPGSDKRFAKDSLKANKELLYLLPKNNIYGYPMNDTITTYNILESVTSGLIEEYNVVLASLGPKIFGLCCFLLSTKYPEMSVWRVGAGSKGPVVDHKPSRKKVILETEWRR